MSNSRVVVTGIGVVSPIGNEKSVFFANLLGGVSGISRVPWLREDRVAGQVDLEEGSRPGASRTGTVDRFSEFALAAADQAMSDARLSLGERERARTGIYLGTGMGGARTVERSYVELYSQGKDRVNPMTVPAAMNNAAAAHVALRYGLEGPAVTYSCACASSAVAIGEACRAIKHGYADTVLAGGVESLLTFGVLKAWAALSVLAPTDLANPSQTCKPFARDRSGLVLGEGAAIVILERLDQAYRRGAPIYCEVVGYGVSNDAVHLTKPCSRGQARAMGSALQDAGMRAEDIDYINLHGTATPVGDKVETNAIKAVFGDRAATVPMSATKSMHGHLMGAAGAVEFVASVLAIRHQAIPPTAHLRIPDPDCDLDYVPNVGRVGQPVRTVMSNSFAFGGTNVVLIARAD